MKLTDFFLAQLEREVPLARKALERIPAGKESWKPHEKSMEMGYLSLLVAIIPSWIASIVEQPELDIGIGEAPSSAKQDLVKILESGAAKARRALEGTNDAHLMTNWRLLYKGKVLADQPRHIMIADSVLGHLSHHRGQLTVYLRLNGAPVPAIYGASADEGW